MNHEAKNVVVVAIGLSSKDVKDLGKFLSKINSKDVAIVVVQNFRPQESTIKTNDLLPYTQSPILEIEHGLLLEAGNLYLTPADKLISLNEGKFTVQELSGSMQRFSSIDWFMQSIANKINEKAVGILLAKDSLDGSAGLKAISENGGLTFAQNPEFKDLGFSDHVSDTEKIADLLHTYIAFLNKLEKNSSIAQMQEEIGAALTSICDLLLKHSQHDFKHYKTSTLIRRIQRRMLVLQKRNVDEYVEILNEDRTERESLFNDLLINVTSFFRDREAFEIIKNDVLRVELKKVEPKTKYRIWIAGCSTGQEAYSMAILAQEVMQEYGMKNDVQIIATDIDEEALSVARKGEYPLSIADKVSPERLEKFFVRRNNRFVVNRSLREMILFSSHNLINDPPFSQVNLISCRNVLIYLGPHLQKKLFSVFHYSLKPNGFLFLGTSEALGTHKELFNTINVKYRLAQRRPVAINNYTQNIFSSAGSYLPNFSGAPKNQEEDIHLIAQRIVLDEFAPRFAIVSEEGQIISLSADFQEYLEPNEGVFQNNIVKLVLSNLRTPLRSSLNDAKKYKRQIQSHSAVIKNTRGHVKIGIVVQPMPQLGEYTGLYMIVFRDQGIVSEKDNTNNHSGIDHSIVEELETELGRLREDLDKSIQDLEASNEELKSSNEELLSMNEELQSANEELEISKEEVQQGNEILMNNNIDLENLLNSTKIATIFLDEDLKIRNFTPYVSEIYDLMPQDIGRSINSFNSKALSMPKYSNPSDLKPDQVVEAQVIMPDGRIFLRRKSAYLDQTKKKIGLVVTFLDVSDVRRSEDMFKTLANSVPQMIWSTDNKGNYLYFSEQWHEFSGIDPAEIKNKGFREIIHPDDRDAALTAWVNAQENSDYFGYEYRLKDKNGIYHWHLLRAKSLKDPTGKIIRWFGTCTNIQEAKDLEMNLRSSEQELIRNQERFNNVSDAVELGVWYCNLPFDELIWSDTVKKHFWCAPSDRITIKTFYDRIHEDDLEKTREAIESSIKDNTHYDIYYRTVDPDSGNIKWIRAIGWTDYDKKGTPIRFDGVTLDVTDDLKTLDAVRDSEWRYAMASKAARELIWDWNLVTNYCEWNESLSTEFGYRNEERFTTGDWWLTRIHPEDKERVSESIHQVIDNKLSYWDEEYRFLRADGTYAYVVDRGYLQLDNEGNAIRMIGTMYDQTEKNNYLKQMEEAIKARDEFLSIASHELKTPLTSMVLQMQMLKRRIEKGEFDVDIIHKANELSLKQCRHLNSLIDDMLDVSRVSNGKMTFNFKENSLEDVVNSAIDAFSVNIEEKAVKLNLIVSSNSVIKADPFRLEQVIYNLLSNALKYGDNKPIDVIIRKDNGFAVVEIKDYGLGVSVENIERIFNLFERAISSTSISGLGLGLYISKQIVDAHGGKIEVESKLNAGSTFRVILPL